ncbi:MAG: ADP-ribosyl-[dinitrogen reductase] hydrolase [Polyangiaceae bacterium]
MLERAEAAFVGYAIGDAFGATTEFMTPGEIQSQYGVLEDVRGGGWLHLPVGAVTDDTEMSLCVARSLVQNGFVLVDIADRFVAWMKTRPRDIGGTCRRGIRRYLLDGSLEAPLNEADGGNGAAMRMTPIALATLGEPEDLCNWGIRQAHLTHHHPLSDGACLLVGQLIQLALVGHGKDRLAALVESCIEIHPAFAFKRHDGYCSAYVVDTMRTVLQSFFTTKSFEECLVMAVNRGGDADTVGAIVGGIAGAYYGPSAIPKRWRRALDSNVEGETTQLARELIRSSPIAKRGGDWFVAREFLRIPRR